jgi:NitT/TauT family transport system substrate-binding protein
MTDASLDRTAGGLTRRSFLAAGSATAGLLALPGSRARAATLRPVSMRLDWVFQGPNSGFIVAREKGFYEQVGLDVTIGPGKGSGSTAQLIATKASQFGFADGFVVGNSVAKGMNIRMVGAVYRRNPTAVVVLEESGIRTARDLEGKSIGIPAGAAQFQQFPAFLKGCGVDPAKVRIVNVDSAGSAPALITGQVNAVAGFAQGYVPGIEFRGGKKTRLLWYADCGVSAVSNGIIVHNDLLREDPALVRDFTAASLRGFLYGRRNPEEVVTIVKKYLETIEPAITRRELELSWNTWVTPNTAGKPLGWMSDKDWASTVEVLKTYGGVSTPLEASQLYTNEFVPSGAEFVPPQPA